VPCRAKALSVTPKAVKLFKSPVTCIKRVQSQIDRRCNSWSFTFPSRNYLCSHQTPTTKEDEPTNSSVWWFQLLKHCYLAISCMQVAGRAMTNNKYRLRIIPLKPHTCSIYALIKYESFAGLYNMDQDLRYRRFDGDGRKLCEVRGQKAESGAARFVHASDFVVLTM